MTETVYSVGIDVGTTTTQVIFSRLFLERSGGFGCIPKVEITGKEVVYQSPVHFTPLLSHDVIDAAALREIVASEYRNSALGMADITTGAVIVTGESARKKNAQAVAAQLADFAGDFVVCTAGPDYESVLAGWGAGAGEYSRRHSGRIGNFDIGGGTTNAAIFQDGEVVDAFAADIGGRVVKIDRSGVVTYVSDKIAFLAEALRLHSLRVGQRAVPEELQALAARMADMFPELIGQRPLRPDTRRLFIGHGHAGLPLERVMFSGGVAEYIYDDAEDFDPRDAIRRYGDLGPLLGYSIRRILPQLQARVLHPTEKIRATVVGAGNYSLGLSGSTIAVCAERLPMKNLPVLQVSARAGTEGLGTKLAARLSIYEGEPIAVAVSDLTAPDYPSLKCLAAELLLGLAGTAHPVLILTECDCAKALGLLLQTALHGAREVLCLDQIRAENGDYIDIGKPICGVVPVVVKSLIFH